MKRYLEYEDQLKLKEIYWVDKGNAGYAKFHPLRPAPKEDLASALREIFKIALIPMNDRWEAVRSPMLNNLPYKRAIDKDADTATLLVVSKIMEKE